MNLCATKLYCESLIIQGRETCGSHARSGKYHWLLYRCECSRMSCAAGAVGICVLVELRKHKYIFVQHQSSLVQQSVRVVRVQHKSVTIVNARAGGATSVESFIGKKALIIKHIVMQSDYLRLHFLN